MTFEYLVLNLQDLIQVVNSRVMLNNTVSKTGGNESITIYLKSELETIIFVSPSAVEHWIGPAGLPGFVWVVLCLF